MLWQVDINAINGIPDFTGLSSSLEPIVAGHIFCKFDGCYGKFNHGDFKAHGVWNRYSDAKEFYPKIAAPHRVFIKSINVN